MAFLNSEGLARLWSHVCSEINEIQSQISNHTHDELIVDNANYGDTLPSTGVEGQIFFKKVT